MKSLLQKIINHPKLVLLLVLIISAPFLYHVLKIQVVNNIDYFKVNDDPDVAYFKEFEEVFGNVEFFVIAYQPKNCFSKDHLTFLQTLTEQLETIDGIREVTSLANVDDIIGDEDNFNVKGFLESIPEDPATLAHLQKQAVNNPLYRNSIISKDGLTPAIIVFPEENDADHDFRSKIVKQTWAILNQAQKKWDLQFYLAGWTITNFSTAKYMHRDLFVFLPVAYLVFTLLLWLIFRNLPIVLLIIATISVALGNALGFLTMIGSNINTVTVIIPPLVLAIGLANAVHVMTHYLQFQDHHTNPKDALWQGLVDTYQPCFLAALTTSIGMLSLRLSKIGPIQDTGLIIAIGVLWGYLLAFTLLPALIRLFYPHAIPKKLTNYAHYLPLKSITKINLQHPKFLLAFFVLLTVLAIFGTSKVKVETNLINWFKAHAPLRIAIDFVEHHLAGVENIDISLVAREPDTFKEPHALQFVAQVQAYADQLPAIDTTLSIVDFVKDMHQSFHNEDQDYYAIPNTRPLIAQYFLLYGSDDIEDVINDDFDHARIIVRTAKHSTHDLEKIIISLRHYLQQNAPPNISAKVTGIPVRTVNAINELVHSQIKSLAATLIIISILLFLVFRSFKLGLLSLAPNLFPILLNFSLMGYFGIPLNSGTALISAMAIGIAVDDTLHFLYHFREQALKQVPWERAIERTITVKGPAIIITSTVLFFGFGVDTMASFLPVIHFGILSSIIMLSALLSDLFLLPAILLTIKPKLHLNNT